MKKPTPGSREAKTEGCTCPPDENHNGDGTHIASAVEGEQYFVVAKGCPLHGMK